MFQADPNNFRELRTTNRPDIILRMTRNDDTGEVFVGSSDAKVYQVDPMVEQPEFLAMEAVSYTHLTLPTTPYV